MSDDDPIDEELANDPVLSAEIVEAMNLARERNGGPFMNDMPGFAMTPPDRIAEIRACSEADGYGYAPEGAAAVRTLLHEIERLRAELSEALDSADVSHGKAHRFSLERDAAFRAGAEAMREAVLREPWWNALLACRRDAVRALPVPEAKR